MITLDSLISAIADLVATPRPLADGLARAREAMIAAAPDLSNLANLVARLYDPDLDPGWLWRLRSCTKLVLTTVAAGIDTSPSCRHHIVQALARVQAPLLSFPDPCGKLSLLAHPVAAFHVFLWRLFSRRRVPIYSVVAGLIHARARALERGMWRQPDAFERTLARNLYEPLHAGRVLCLYALPIGQLPRHLKRELLLAIGGIGPVASGPRLIETALGRWAAHAKPAPSLELVERRRLHLGTLLGLRDREIHPHRVPARGALDTGTIRWPDRVHVAGPVSDADADDVSLTDVPVDLPREAAEEGELPVDYLVARTTGRPVGSRPGTGPRGRAPVNEHAIMAQLGFVHDASTAQLFESAEVYANLFGRPAAAMDAEQCGTALAAALTMMYGIPPSILDPLSVSAGPPEGDEVAALDPVAGVLWTRLLRVATGVGLSPNGPISCRPGSEWVSVPLMPWVAQFATRWWALRTPWQRAAGLGVFSSETGIVGEPAVPTWRRSVILTERGKHLARSAVRWFVHRGMEPVLAAMCSTRFTFRTLAASAYANVSQGQLAQAHAQAAGRLHQDILAECRHQGRPLHHLEASGLVTMPELGDRRFGSRLVPQQTMLADSIAALEATLRPVDIHAPLRTLIPTFNLRAVHTALRLASATGIRPCRDPVVRRGSYSADRDVLLVEDKDSPFSIETRLVPLAQGEGARLMRFEALGQHVRLRLRTTTGIALDQFSEDCLFFVVREGRAVPLTPRRIREVLADAGLGDRFPWPLNSPRHCLVTRALELGIPLATIEPFLGHLHDPLPWGPHALLPFQRVADPFRSLGRRLVREAGFRRDDN